MPEDSVQNSTTCREPLARWELTIVALAVVLALILGFANLGKPSIWHDELVHVYVAKSMLAHGWPRLPSGNPYVSGVSYSAVLAGFIAFFGDSEVAVRTLSVLVAGLNVLVTYFLFRRLLGKPAAAVAALTLALSPWSVAWSRQARFYALQELVYLLTLWSTWKFFEADDRRSQFRWGIGAIALYVVGIFTSLHSILFLAPAGAYALLRGIAAKRVWTRWTAACCIVAVAGGSTLLIYSVSLPRADRDAIFREGGLGGKLADPSFDIDRGRRYYYFDWLGNNLSVGYFALAMFGFAAMIIKEQRRGVYAALGFWAPLLVLTFLIGYRRERFMYFTYPCYVAAHSYGLVCLAQFLPTARRSWIRAIAAIAILVFSARLAWTSVKLVRDSFETARGSDTTLAVLHPQWRKPCLYVRDHLDDAVVISTSYLPPLYYIGRVDNWYPSRIIVWEEWECGLPGLKELSDLQSFVRAHPKGYFIAELQRFNRWKQFDEDKAWVEANMKRLDTASGRDVFVYAWGM